MKRYIQQAVEIFQNKYCRKAIYFGGMVVFLTGYTLSCATDDRHQIISREVHPDHFVDHQVVSKWMEQYPELFWYTEEKEGGFLHHETPSEAILGRSVPSFNKVILSLRSLSLILNGQYEDYLEFVNDQSKECKLSWEQFLELQEDARNVISSYRGLNQQEILQVIELAIVLNNIHETPVFQRKAHVFEIERQTGQLYSQCALEQHSEMFPSFSALNDAQKRIFSRVFGQLDLGEIFRLRGLITTFEVIRESRILKEDPAAFELAFLTQKCVLAGARGDINSCSSLMMDGNAYENLSALHQAFALLRDTGNEKDAYKFYLTKRANWLGFDPGSPLNRVLTRFGGMMNLYSEAEGKALKESFLRLRPELLSAIIDEFDDVLSPRNGCPYPYVSTMMYNLVQNNELGKSRKEQIASTVQIGFNFLGKVLAIKDKRTADGSYLRMNFEKAADLAIRDPHLLTNGSISLTKEGVILVSH